MLIILISRSRVFALVNAWRKPCKLCLQSRRLPVRYRSTKQLTTIIIGISCSLEHPLKPSSLMHTRLKLFVNEIHCNKFTNVATLGMKCNCVTLTHLSSKESFIIIPKSNWSTVVVLRLRVLNRSSTKHWLGFGYWDSVIYLFCQCTPVSIRRPDMHLTTLSSRMFMYVRWGVFPASYPGSRKAFFAQVPNSDKSLANAIESLAQNICK